MSEYDNTPEAQRRIQNSREVLASLVGRDGIDPNDIMVALTEINLTQPHPIDYLTPDKVLAARRTIDILAEKPRTQSAGARLVTHLENIQFSINNRVWKKERAGSLREGFVVTALGTVTLSAGLLILGVSGADIIDNVQRYQMDMDRIRQAFEPARSTLRMDGMGMFAGFLASIFGTGMLANGIDQIKNFQSQDKFIKNRYGRI